MEIWKDVDGYNGLYQISTFGRVRSYNQNNIGKILKQFVSFEGYVTVVFTVNYKSKNKSIHRLIGIAFIDNPENKPYINHKDANKENNNISNLEWCTPQENVRHAMDNYKIKSPNNGIPVVQKRLDGTPIKIWKSMMEAKRDTLINNGDICMACIGKYPHAGGFLWSYF